MKTKSVALNPPDRKQYGTLSITTGDLSETTSVDDNANCTVLETTCNLVSVLTGSGMLSLPYAAARAGWSAVFILIALCSIFLYSFELLAASIETLYKKETNSNNKSISSYNIDYLSFAKLSFGKHGDKIVSVVFGTEVSLALVLFLMNIGINLHVLNPSISVSMGILFSAVITCIMSFSNLKSVAFSSMTGLALTLLTVASIFASGAELQGTTLLHTREYKTLDVSGVPIAIGLVAFCFGGHGTFPRMYTSMTERHRYREVLWSTAFIVLALYLVVMCSGYHYFAQYTLTPVTLNIGKDLAHHDTIYGVYWKVSAALGIICNLQVTCPLVTFAIRDMVVKICDLDSTVEVNQRIVVICILVVITPIALTLSGNFAAVCSLIGSLATIANSVLLPMVFYHTVHAAEENSGVLTLHATILVVAICSTLIGIYANFSSILDCAISGDVRIISGAIVHPRVSISASEDNSTLISAGTIIEEMCHLKDTSVGKDCLLGIGTVISESIIGSSTQFGPKCMINNCNIGANCIIGPAIVLSYVTIPDNTSVYMEDGRWTCRQIAAENINIIRGYQDKLSNPESINCMSKNFTPHQHPHDQE